MPLDSSPEKVTPLSNARSVRKDIVSEEKLLTESKMREILGQFMNPLSSQIGDLSSKVTRLENSISLMQTQFEAIKNGEADDAALRVTTDETAAVDIASMRAEIYKEDWYIYTTGHLADKLGISLNKTVQIIKICLLKGEPKYHTEISTGRSDTSKVQKYSEDALIRLKQELNSAGQSAL
jgi:outer membrane murein-binding lipoprotein Lpp